jgi:hypothetical protein
MIDLDAITKEIVKREARNKRNSEREAKAIKKYKEDIITQQTYHTYQQLLKDGTIKPISQEFRDEYE